MENWQGWMSCAPPACWRRCASCPEPAYRFRHALIQEATYGGMLRRQRRQLHARAAWGLEAASADRLEEMAAVLGHHYAAAGESERAVRYLEVAGDHAAGVFANDEALASYSRALEIVDQDRPGTPWAKPAWSCGPSCPRSSGGAVASARRERLSSRRWSLSTQQPLQAARLQARLGRVEVEDHQFDAAVAAFDAASELLGDTPTGQDEQWADLWLEVQVDGRASLYYWGNEPDKAAVVLANARPVVEALGSPVRKAGLYVNLTTQRLRETRYRIDDETLANARAAVKAAEEGVGEHDMASVLSSVGFLLLWHGDFTEAQEKLEVSFAIAERVGDPFRRAMCLCYLNLIALRRHDVDFVRSLAPQVIAAGEVARYPAYVAAGKATLAWVAWKDQRFEDVVPLATEALEVWGTVGITYPFKWPCLWPLISVHLASGQIADAVDASRQLLMPPQQRLPDELESVLEAAGASWDRGEYQLAKNNLTAALELAGSLGYA